MKIYVSSIYVDSQDQALKFYGYCWDIVPEDIQMKYGVSLIGERTVPYMLEAKILEGDVNLDVLIDAT